MYIVDPYTIVMWKKEPCLKRVIMLHTPPPKK